MNSRFKKRYVVGILVGLIGTIIPGYFVYQNYLAVSGGQKVTAIVTNIIAVASDDGTNYKPEYSYRFQGIEQTYVPSYSASKGLIPDIGDERPLYVNGNKVSEGYKSISMILPGIFAVIGLIILLSSIGLSIKSQKKYSAQVKLKRYGRKVTARYIRKDLTSYRINDQAGEILYFQQEGGEPVFQTAPIFSHFSIKWLEEHPFDVYVDVRNPAEYYVDLEKHFGEPTNTL